MPIYVYVCPKCGIRKEEIVSSSAGVAPPPCSVCGVDMERALTSAAFKIK